ncbi:MAG: dUTP diphosphatase [Halobacteriota archaeon]|nr:dUTP diphosphatase [Halobacteriota archaeon]
MESVDVKIKLLRSGARVPEKAMSGDICYDIFLPEDALLESRKVTSIGTGIAIEPEPGFGLLVRDKSSMVAKNITVHGGEIDNGYRGECRIMILNSNDEDVRVFKGQKIAQVRPIRIRDINWDVTDELSDTERGNGGFGSTGMY